MDNYVIPKGAPHPNAAYAWIDYLLQPEVSLKELEYIGYHTGVKDIEPAAKQAGFGASRHGLLLARSRSRRWSPAS